MSSPSHPTGSELVQGETSLHWDRDKSGGGKGRRKRLLELVRRYAGDWVLTIALAGAFWSVNRARGFRSQFSLENKSIQYTYISKERVPTSLLAATALVAPVVIQATVCLALGGLNWYDFHQSALGLILTHGITLTVTTVIKVAVGRCRPDFIDRCQPYTGAADPSPFGLSTEAVCTTSSDSSLIRDGFRSFPSGHSSTAFAGLSFLTLFLAGHFHLYGDRARVWVSWLVASPPLGAALIAITRLMDNRHHPSDVLTGALLGSVVASFIYHQYYPPLNNSNSHKPYKPSDAAITVGTRSEEIHGLLNDPESGETGLGSGERSDRHRSAAE